MTHTITRKSPTTGFQETIEYTGPVSGIPRGWKLVRDNAGPEATYTLSRISPTTGFKETMEFSGPLSQKPPGWIRA